MAPQAPGGVGCEDAHRAASAWARRIRGRSARASRSSLAAERVDEPEGPWFTERPFTGWMTVGWDGNPREAWLATDEAHGRGLVPAGAAGQGEPATRPTWHLVVHPADRRRGVGRALLRHAARRAAAHGRTALSGGARDGSAGEAFARSAGAKPGLVEVQRVLDLGKLETGSSPGCAARPSGRRRGTRWCPGLGPVPEEYIEQAATVFNAMNDAPRDPEVSHEEWDAQRVRERVNDLRPQYGMRDYTVAARHDATGELAGADRGLGRSGRPWLGVPAVHGGDQAAPRAPARPAGEDRDDGTAADGGAAAGADRDLERPSNEHMIAVNEAIGYTVFGAPNTAYQLDVAAVPAAGEPWPAWLPVVAAGRLLGHRDHADDLGLGHAEVDADGQRGLPLGVGERAVRQRDADHLGQVPLPGLDGELRSHLVQGRADRLERPREVGVEHGLVVARHARADDRLDRPLPRHRARRVAGSQHDRDRGPHAGRQRGLHLRRGRLGEHVRHVTGPAGGALDVLADLVQRDDRDEEQREPPAPGPVPVLPVPAAAAAVEDALRDRPVEHAQAEDDQARWSRSSRQRTREQPGARRRAPARLCRHQLNPSAPPALAPPLPMPIAMLGFAAGAAMSRPERRSSRVC